jgi:putative heme-binding domain-containing protein
MLAALASPQPEVVRIAAGALAKLEKPKEAAEITPVLQTLREYLTPGKHADVRAALASLLANWTEQNISVDERAAKDLAATYKPWFDWFATAHPNESKKLAASAAPDAAEWANRLQKIAWGAGDAKRGELVFDRRSCSRCHGQNSRLGPDLVGVTRRLSREDLFTAIIDPNKDVSPLYQTTQVTTRTGQVYVGVLVYESPEGTLLQTGADTTIRITDEDIDRRRPSRTSLMPTGLLKDATDAEIADLYQYLQSRDANK